MSLPIVVVFERHWDEIPKLLVKQLLPELVKEGYDTLCLEGVGHDLTESEIAARHECSLKGDNTICSDVKKFFKKAKVQINDKLSDINFEELARLIQLHVSSKDFGKIAERIKGLPTSLLLKDIIKEANQLKVLIKGVDINSKDYSRMLSGNLLERDFSIVQNEDYRIKTIGENLLQLHEERKGLIFSIGALHSDNLIAKFKEQDLQDDIICYFPHLPKCSNDKLDKTTFKILSKKESLKDSIYCLSNEKEVKSLAKRVVKEIKSKQRTYKAVSIEDNSHCTFLNEFFKSQFKAFKRAGHYIDALLKIVPEIDVESITQKLQRLNIQTRQIFFQEHKYLVVSAVNTTEVAENIRKL